MRKERSVLALVEEGEYTREILRRKSDQRKDDIGKIQNGNVNYYHAVTVELWEMVCGGDQAMRASNYKIITYKTISLSQVLCKVLKSYGLN